MLNNDLLEKINNIPQKPGCYLWKNKNNDVIYVGKAKKLLNRVKQYLVNIVHPKKIALMNEVFDIDYIITNNVNEALILESNLIKKYMPKYNILLKDESEYPYIIVSNEMYPRLLYSRKTNKIPGKYYGPLADPNFKRFNLYKILNQLLPYRKCNKIPNKKCMYYDIGQCLGPCINKIDPNIFNKYNNIVNDLFKNKTNEICKIIKNKEINAANLMQYEQALEYKNTYDAIKALENKQIVQIGNNELNDYVAYYAYNNLISIIIFKFVDNKLISKYNMIEEIMDNEQNTVYHVINNYYHVNIIPNKIIIALDDEILNDLNNVFNISNKFCYPNQNELKIISSALINAKEYYTQNSLKHLINNNKLNNNIEYLKKILNLNSLNRMEIIDISNLQLTNSVSFVNVYINGYFDSRLSRPYILKSTDNKSDFEYMKEVIKRRYKDINEKIDLIILDGGKIQINAAKIAFKEINKTIKIIGLQKNDKHQTECIMLDNYEIIPLDKKSDFYLFLLSLQDKIHNNAINFFRQQKIKNDFVSLLESIPGLGKNRIAKLYNHFNNINEIKNSTIEYLAQILPKNIAINVYNFFNKNK